MIEENYDICIIGAGISGCSLAHQLQLQYPHWRIALFDQDKIGSGCTGYAGAIASPLAGTATNKVASAFSKQWYLDHLQTHPDSAIRPVDVVFISQNKNLLEQRSENPLTTLNQPNLTLPSWMQVPDAHKVFGAGQGLHANPLQLCEQYLSLNPTIDVFECTVISDAKHDPCRLKKRQWQLTTGDGRIFTSRFIAKATGAWFDEQQHKTAPQVAERRKKIVSYILDIAADNDVGNKNSPLVYLFDHEAFLLPVPNKTPQKNRWVMSITSTEWDCLPNKANLHANADELALAKRILSIYCPSMVESINGASVHCDGYNQQRRPNAQLTDDDCLYLGGGSGSGFRYAPFAINAAIDLLSQGLQS